MKAFIASIVFLVTVSAHAALPAGTFRGSLSTNSMRDICELNSGTVQFEASRGGQYNVYWLEEGRSRDPRGGFCESRLDATFSPTERENVWNVNFIWHTEISGARAVLNGDTLTITGTMNTRYGFQRLNVRMVFDTRMSSLSYDRVLESAGRSSSRASGTLYQR